MFTIQPSTILTLATLAGDSRGALDHGRDIADLLHDDAMLTPDESALFAAAIAPALIIAARRMDRSATLTSSARLELEVNGHIVPGLASICSDHLEAAGVAVTEALVALRDDRPSGDALLELRSVVTRALIFQLTTDDDERDALA